MKIVDFTKPSSIVIKLANIMKGGAVLDIGAGNGRNAFYLAERGFEVFATEFDTEKVTQLQKINEKAKHKISVDQADVNGLDADKKYDAVLCAVVLHFLDEERINDAIQKIQKATKPGGYNVISAYTDKNPLGMRPYLFKHNQLRNFYDTWEIIEYTEKLTPWIVSPVGSQPRRNHTAYLFARKMST